MLRVAKAQPRKPTTMKMFPYPQPRLYVKVRNASRNTINDHGTRIIQWMDKNALRRLREHEVAGVPFPTAEDLSEWIQETHTQALDHLADARYFQKCDDAAAWALEAYNSGVYEKAVERGRKGGLKSKRPPTFTLEHLDAVSGMSLPEQAEALGCSLSTISRLRRASKAHTASQPISVDDDIDAFLAKVDRDLIPAKTESFIPAKADPEPVIDTRGYFDRGPEIIRAEILAETLAHVTPYEFMADLLAA